MKKLFCALMALGLLLQATNAIASTPILTVETYGGFVPPDRQGWGEKLIVYPNGRVITSYRPNFETSWDNQLIATLSAEVMGEITMALNDLSPGQLSFPDDPECTDMPVTTYSAKNGQGDSVEFAQIVACRVGYLESFNKSYTLKSILDGLKTVANGYHGLGFEGI
jgi:hypothetical protein